MESIQEYIDRLEAKIEFFRFRARQLRLRGRLLRWPGAIVVLIIGGLAAFSVLLESARTDPLLGGPKIERLESAIFDPHPIIWGLFYKMGPPAVPVGAQGDKPGFLIWLMGWMAVFLGTMLLGERALKKSVSLEARAEKDEDILVAHRPTWTSLEQMSRHLENLPGGGTGNITTVVSSDNEDDQPPGRKPKLVAVAIWHHFVGCNRDGCCCGINKVVWPYTIIVGSGVVCVRQ